MDAKTCPREEAGRLRASAAAMQAEAEANIAAFEADPSLDPTGRRVAMNEETLYIAESMKNDAFALEVVANGVDFKRRLFAEMANITTRRAP